MLEKAHKLAQSNRLDDAEKLYDTLIRNKPRNAVVLQAAIKFHNRYSRKFRAAVPLVETLLQLKPKLPAAHALAAETYCNCKRPFLALPHADRAVALAPDDADCLFIAAVTAMEINQHPKAMAHIERALTMRPDHRPSQIQKCRALRNLGELSQAHDIARNLLSQAKDDLNALELYFGTAKIDANDPGFVDVQIRLLPAFEKMGGGVLAALLQLIGKAQNDQGVYDAAFRSFQNAKSLSSAKHDGAVYAQFVSAVSNRISKDDFRKSGNPTRQPLLIVGMPRCGSTLLAQILSGHRDIVSAGESTSLNVIVQDIRVRRHNGADLAQAIKQIPPDAVDQLATRYLSEISQGGSPIHIIDKSLHNFELLGFFARLFPLAPIIHMTRDPMDTCVSCYMQPLSAWHSYTNELENLGKYYLQYQRLMEHWQAVLPNPMLTIRYEDLVEDTKTTARQVTNFLGLPWDATCLDFQATANTSATLSAWQVRQPIYTTAKSRWHRYEAHLDPLKSALAPLYPDGFTATYA